MYAGAGAPSSFGAPLATWGQRALGGLIDFLGPAIVSNLLVVSGGRALGNIIGLLGLVWGVYNAWLNGTTGQSVGKKVAGLKVVDANTGQLIGGGKGILRWLAHIVDAIICYIGFLFPLWDSKKQTLADKIVGTVVLNVGK
jgi:uncharacterized RDD family membrane protein YckC